MVNTKEFAASSNGDRWLLESDDATNSLVGAPPRKHIIWRP